MPVIVVDGVSHSYGDDPGSERVLSDVTVTLTEQRIGVIGANGSGKSTFARLMNGLVVPQRGTVAIDGLSTAKQGKEVRRLVGFCFTDPDAQIIMPTVREDVAFSLRSTDLTKDEVRARVDETLERFHLGLLGDHPSHLLSGGQKQLLALAAVLITEPRLIVMDEPTTLLDLRNSRMISEVIATLPTQIMLVTHHLDLLREFDRVLVFDDGELVCDAIPADAISHYTKLFG